MRLMRFQFTISHVPGKDLSTADTLSRAPVRASSFTDEQFNQEVTAFGTCNMCLQIDAQSLYVNTLTRCCLNSMFSITLRHPC